MSLELLNNPLTGNFKDWDKPWANEDFQAKFPAFPSKQENTTRRKSFEEISFERKFGEENKCIETNLGKFFSGQMRIDELIHDLYDNQNNDNFFFNFGNYAMNYGFALNNENPDMMLTLIKNASADFSRSIKYKYIDNHNYTREADVSVELNLMPCLVDVTQPGFEYILDSSSESIKYCIKYVYSNYLGKRIFDESKKVYTIENDYNAIIISSKNGDDFLAIVNDNFKNPVKTKIIQNFVNQLQATTSPEGLKFLYENMPSFVLKELKTYLPNETLWQHLITLTRYDYKGYLSVFKDASGALIKLLRAFKDSKFLYDKFKADQTLIKTIFNNLDDISEIDGEITTNKLAFASFLSALCLYNSMEGLRTLDKTFISNQDYIFNSSDNLPRDEKGNEFYLQQLKKAIIKSTEIIPDDLPRMVERVPIETTEFLPTERGDYYHPLDIVFLKDSTEENAIAMPVAAILIKAIANERERIERQRAIRIGFDILAIVLGVITVATTANPGVLALAIADIALSSGDIVVQSAAPELQKTKEGQEFLEAWENIYLVGGIITAGPVLIENIFTLGGKLFLAAKAVKNFKVMNFVKACLIKIILERNIANFGKSTLTIVQTNLEIVNATKGFFNEFKFSYLTKQNVFLVTNESTQEVAFVYRGEAIIKGKTTDKAFKEKMLELSRVCHNESKLLEYLESKYNFAVLLKNKNFLNTYTKVLQEKHHLLKQFINFEEEAVIRFYTTSAYEDLNKFLRGLLETKNVDKIKELEAFADALRKALNKLPNFKSKNLLYRIENLTEQEIRETYKIGEIIESKQFVSATYSEEAISKIMRTAKYTVLIRIEGKSGKLIESVSEFPLENEILFNTDRKFLVKEIGFEYNPLEPWKPIKRIILIEK